MRRHGGGSRLLGLKDESDLVFHLQISGDFFKAMARGPGRRLLHPGSPSRRGSEIHGGEKSMVVESKFVFRFSGTSCTKVCFEGVVNRKAHLVGGTWRSSYIPAPVKNAMFKTGGTNFTSLET